MDRFKFLPILLFWTFFSSFSMAQYAIPSHSKGTCHEENGMSQSKGQIKSITMYNNDTIVNEKILVFHQPFSENYDCKTAVSDGFYRLYNTKNMFYLSEGQEYVINIETFNPDSTETFVPCGIWIDFNMDSVFDPGTEFIRELIGTCDQPYRHAFKFTVPSTSTSECRMRIRTMTSSGDASSSSLEFGESIDLRFKMFSPDQLVADFWLSDTVVSNAYVNMVSGNPQARITNTWTLDTFQYTEVSNRSWYVFKDTGWVRIKLISKDTSGSMDSITKKVYVSEPNEAPTPAFDLIANKRDLYQEILMYDLSEGWDRYLRWTIYEDQDTFNVTSPWRPTQGNKVGAIFSARGIPSFPDEGLYGICLEVSHDTSKTDLTRKVCKDKILIIGTDVVPPVVTLIGPDTVCTGIGTPFTDQGAVAYDNCDGDITTHLIFSTNLDESRAGVYYVIYNVQDSDGNADTAIRVVIVGCENVKDARFLTGTLFLDRNQNCELDSGDRGIPMLLSLNDEIQSVLQDGSFGLLIRDTGEYRIKAQIPDRLRHLLTDTCLSEQVVQVSEGFNFDTAKVNIGFQFRDCPQLYVDISSDRRRRCFRNTTVVKYCNEGFASVDSVSVVVEFPKYVHLIKADHAFTVNKKGQLVFAIGKLGEGRCGEIKITDSVACENGITGITQCTKAWINPTNKCARDLDSTLMSWDGSDLTVHGSCIGDSVLQFVLSNSGDSVKGDMADSSAYRIYTGNKLRHSGKFLLKKGDSLVIETPVQNVFPVRFEADQGLGHPKSRFARSILTDCDSSRDDDVGLLLQLPSDDAGQTFEEHCLPILDGKDPNDKQVHPSGVTDAHFIPPGSMLEYRIRFQNTGNDTAYHVVIVDTLDPNLVVTSIQFGATSHVCIPRIRQHAGKTILEFDLEDIYLPDSMTNERASQGFVQFKVNVAPGTPLGTTITNFADIYFDFNLPVRTNETIVTLSDTVITGGPLTVKESGEVTKCFMQPVSVEYTDKTLEAWLPGSRYQWLDCEDTYSEIPGEDSARFTPERNGVYAVEARVLGCADTSECIVMDKVGVQAFSPGNRFAIYPNPTKDGITVASYYTAEEMAIKVTDVFGHEIASYQNDNADKIDVSLPQVPGIYLIRVHSNGMYIGTYKVIKL